MEEAPPDAEHEDAGQTPDALGDPSAIARALDLLVRNSVLQVPNLDRLVDRVWGLLVEAQDVEFSIEPDGIRVGEKLVHKADVKSRWILPAFMAGMRSLRAMPDLNEDDVSRLSLELAALEPEMGSVVQFRDWLWADGAEGFEIKLDLRVTEVLEAIEGEHAISEYMGTYSAITAAGQGGTELDEIDQADALGAYEVLDRAPDPPASPVGPPRFDREAREALREVCDDGGAWAAAEISAAMSVASLRRTVPTDRLARRVMARASNHAGPRLLGLMADLFVGVDEHKRKLASALQKEKLGRKLARGLALQADGLERALINVLDVAPRHMRRDLLEGLLERAADGDALVVPFLEELIAEIGVELIRDSVEESRLPPEQAVPYVQALCVISERRARALAGAVDRLSDEAAARVVSNLPREQVVLLGGRVDRLLTSGTPKVLQPVLERMVDLYASERDPWGLRRIGSSLSASLGKDWPQWALQKACGALVKDPPGQATLLALVNDRKVATALRVSALVALEHAPDVLARAVGRRGLELFEPREVKDALKSARRWLEGQR